MISCAGCGTALPAPAPTGRPRRFCSGRCRARHHRTPHPGARWADARAALHVGDARAVLRSLEPGSVHAVVTSPPYLGQRAYGALSAGIGASGTVADYTEALCGVFDALSRVLRPDGTAWVNLADRYSGTSNGGPSAHRSARRDRAPVLPSRVGTTDVAPRGSLLHLPARLGIALADRGWLTRNVITWHRPNAMPHPTASRLQTRTESVLVLSRTPAGYYFDREATGETGDVWPVSITPGTGEHPAVMPFELARRMVAASTPPGGTVLDPFTGSGTTGAAALGLGRRFVGIELDEHYATCAARRLGLGNS